MGDCGFDPLDRDREGRRLVVSQAFTVLSFAGIVHRFRTALVALKCLRPDAAEDRQMAGMNTRTAMILNGVRRAIYNCRRPQAFLGNHPSFDRPKAVSDNDSEPRDPTINSMLVNGTNSSSVVMEVARWHFFIMESVNSWLSIQMPFASTL